mmetsp:Transcript_6889/g.20957  ORF Transcript_6889/g.20957 Transcript_6889/m.20957 type:complete len:225 (-) Transcript_6889:2028-2702(-)
MFPRREAQQERHATRDTADKSGMSEEAASEDIIIVVVDDTAGRTRQRLNKRLAIGEGGEWIVNGICEAKFLWNDAAQNASAVLLMVENTDDVGAKIGKAVKEHPLPCIVVVSEGTNIDEFLGVDESIDFFPVEASPSLEQELQSVVCLVRTLAGGDGAQLTASADANFTERDLEEDLFQLADMLQSYGGEQLSRDDRIDRLEQMLQKLDVSEDEETSSHAEGGI